MCPITSSSRPATEAPRQSPVRHGVGAMRPVPSDRLGGKLMRPLLAAMLAVAIGLVLRLAGERAGLANADTDTWLLALSIISLLAGLTWGLAASLGRPGLASGAVQTAWRMIGSRRQLSTKRRSGAR
jgi:hypothetical protein